MIVIRNIDAYEVANDIETVLGGKYPDGLIDIKDPTGQRNERVSVITEHIKGRRYERTDGTTIVVGFSQQAQEVIGITYEAWENADKTIMELSQRNALLHRQIEDYRTEIKEATRSMETISYIQKQITQARWLTRIKWVFTGVYVKDKQESK